MSTAAVTKPVLSTFGHELSDVVTGIDLVAEAPPASVPMLQVTSWPTAEQPAGRVPIVSEAGIESVILTVVALTEVVFVTSRTQLKESPAFTLACVAVFSIFTSGCTQFTPTDAESELFVLSVSTSAATVPVFSTDGHEAFVVVTGIDRVAEAPAARFPMLQVTS